ncbi:Alpha-galactosidase [Glycine soja]
MGCMWPSGISGSIAYNWSWLNMKTGVKIIHASSPPPHSRVFDFVNFDLFVIFAIFIWIGVSVTQWYFGFNRLQLGIYSDAGNQTCSKRMPRSLGHEEKMQKHFLLGYPPMSEALLKTRRPIIFSMKRGKLIAHDARAALTS